LNEIRGIEYSCTPFAGKPVSIKQVTCQEEESIDDRSIVAATVISAAQPVPEPVLSVGSEPVGKSARPFNAAIDLK